MNGVMVAHPGGWDPVNKKSSRIAGYVKIGLGSNPNSSTKKVGNFAKIPYQTLKSLLYLIQFGNPRWVSL